MAVTARELITRSYYLSQIVARSLQTVTGQQITDGLMLLNALLDVKGSDLRLIPYFKRDEFVTIAGEGEYFRPNLLQIDALTFNLGTVRYPMKEMTRKEFFATGRVDNIETLPWSYRIERELGGLRIYLYPLPSEVFTMRLSGKFGLTEVTLDQDMSLTYDLYYLEYLRYALAEYICAEYGNTFPEASQVKLAEIRKKLMDISPLDLRCRKRSFVNAQPGIDWQIVNLSTGWLPY